MRAIVSLLLLLAVNCVSVVDVVGEGEEGEGEGGEGGEGEGEGGEGEGGEGEGGEGEGEGQCQGDEPTDRAVADCDTIPAASCTDESAKAACRDAGLVLRTGLFDAVFDCLAAIPTSACNSLANAVNACFGTLTACANPPGDNLCGLADQACRDFNDDNFTLDTCLADFRPVNQAFLDAWLACFNANPNVPCSDVHDFCYTQAFAALVQ